MNAVQPTSAGVAAGCVYCHAPLNPSRPTQNVCNAVACKRREAREKQAKYYWANPEKVLSRQRDRYHNDPAYRKAVEEAQDRYRTYACSRCGKEGRSNVPLSERPTFVCGQCKRLAALSTKPCWFCKEPVQRRVSSFQSEKCWCQGCFGILTRTGQEWGVSRERVRQIVASYFATGIFATRLLALRAAATQRGLGPPPKVTRFPEFPPLVKSDALYQRTMSPEEVAVWTKAMTS